MRLPRFRAAINLTVVAATLTFCLGTVAAARADFVIVPPNRTVANAVLFNRALNGFRSAIESVQQIYATRAAIGAELVAARGDFWKNIKTSDGYEDRYRRYMQLLLAKDFAYLTAHVAYGPRTDEAFVLSQFGGAIDGGIPSEATGEFRRWAQSIRSALGLRDGAPALASPSRILATLQDPEVVKAYHAYQFKRDRVEFATADHARYFDDQLAAQTRTTEVAFRDTTNDKFLGPGVLRRTYTSAPEPFSPPVDASLLSGPIKYITIEIKDRKVPTSLYRVQVGAVDYADVQRGADFSGKHYLPGTPADRFKAANDLAKRKKLQGYLLTKFGDDGLPAVMICEYRDIKLVGWFGSVPNLSDLPAELSDLKSVSKASARCPERMPER